MYKYVDNVNVKYVKKSSEVIYPLFQKYFTAG